MSDAAELAFINTFARTLSGLPVVYPDDYRQPPENSLKRVPILPIELPPVPKRVKEEAAAASSSASIKLTIKSLKPAHTFTVSASPSDPISALKSILASQPSAPAADGQRLLLKGKVLADGKLLQEYGVKDGDTINLSIKPGVVWDPSAPASTPAPTLATSNIMQTSPVPSPTSLSPNRAIHELPPQPSPPIVSLTEPPTESTASSGKKRGHTRIPSVVLSPSPSGASPVEEKPADILLTFDTSTIPTASEVAGPPRTSFHATISDPLFWERLHAFLRTEFNRVDDAQEAFENFLNSSKGSLSPHEIAKIRDEVGIMGMAGV